MQAPFELAGYEILEKIGEGGMSSVWKARQLSLDRLVAIKTLAASYLPDQEALARFRLEAQAAARLNFPASCRSTTRASPTGCRTSSWSTWKAAAWPTSWSAAGG
jgi:serine/threonine protein kinase